jgi:hypothetical protein
MALAIQKTRPQRNRFDPCVHYVRIISPEGEMLQDASFSSWYALKAWALEKFVGNQLFITYPEARETDIHDIQPNRLLYVKTYESSDRPPVDGMTHEWRVAR